MSVRVAVVWMVVWMVVLGPAAGCDDAGAGAGDNDASLGRFVADDGDDQAGDGDATAPGDGDGPGPGDGDGAQPGDGDGPGAGPGDGDRPGDGDGDGAGPGPGDGDASGDGDGDGPGDGDGGGPADASMDTDPDTGAPVDPNPDSGVPDDLIPMFVAVGVGGRSITSCDNGRTWVADQRDAPPSDDNLHQTYTPKGLAYGHGRFIFLTGWGAPYRSIVRISDNGVDWERTTMTTAYGGVGYDGDRLVLVGNRFCSVSDDHGATWSNLSADEAPAHDRETGAYDGVWVAAADENLSVKLAGDATFWDPASCRDLAHGSIGQKSGHAFGNGILISVGQNGSTCAIDVATGEELGRGSLGPKYDGEPAFVGDAFWAPYNGQLYKSTDGVNWTSSGMGSGIRINMVARSTATGTYVGIDGVRSQFYYSDDGQTWTRAEAPDGGLMVKVVAGFGKPSATCPGS